MLTFKKRRYLTKIRYELGLPPLHWKQELRPEQYQLFDKIIERYVRTVNYMWYFKNVAFYDDFSRITYYFPRLILTRKNLYFLKIRTLSEPVTTTLTTPVWEQSKGLITSPIVTQQFMINRMIKLLDAKQFLRTAIINLVIINSKEPFSVTDLVPYNNIQIISQQEMHWSDIIKHIEKNDDLTVDLFADEAILMLHHLLSDHSHRHNYRLQKSSLFCLYHYI
ncbi:hypothetical protein [Spiroplasma citri]|uniref:Uncharacterized protein n=1 Tax=Spiroplasma citri TaxID=2133 RepID=Q14MH1_SPICI|nr:hypothetical protein [Spiroplasma citri]APE74708.1 hypothetical protein SCITRI_00815 [Spiroplasma citri]QED24584.1 hypothetical protein FRX96_03860 [Spiroplasma citri]QIA66940.1 hypothetical protein GMI18_04315 [Spiroplasma citri]QIA68764.1 hypothetical protein GL298_04105 [Spiroplasma citri]QIA70626.1 hypothetical protein GL981_04125 [Spiroplasma citri]